MEETYKDYNTKCLYFKDRFGKYQPLGQPEAVEYNKYIYEVPTLEITINNPKNVKQYMLESYGRYKKGEVNLSEIKEKVELPERYIINENACILFFKNGEKTVVKRCADDEFNPRLAFLTAFFQHYVDMSKNKANKYLANLQVEVEKEKQKPKHIKKTKFKVGDRVEVIEENPFSQKGSKGKITKIDTTDNTVFVAFDNGKEWWLYEYYLKLIKEGR